MRPLRRPVFPAWRLKGGSREAGPAW
jgi:hypothetical protein